MILPLIGVSFLLSFLLTYPAIILARKLQLVTDSRARTHPAHTHQGIIPRAGGVPIYLAVFLSSLIFLSFNKILIGILLAGALMVLLGLWDDYTDSSPYFRFGANLVISTIVVGFGLGVPFVSNPFGGVIRLDTWRFTIDFFGTHSVIILGDILAVLWLTWCTNMINWSKGVDGQLPGFVAIAAFCLGILASRFSAHDITTTQVTILSFIVAGAYLGFLPHNFYPQRIMPGYGGGGLAGFMLGVLSILSFGKIGTAVVILAIPLIDAFYTMARRIRNKKSPFRADWGHFHHKLLEIGWGRRRIAVFYWIVTGVLGWASLFLQGVEKIIAFMAVGGILVAFILIIDRLKREDLVQ